MKINQPLQVEAQNQFRIDTTPEQYHLNFAVRLVCHKLISDIFNWHIYVIPSYLRFQSQNRC